MIQVVVRALRLGGSTSAAIVLQEAGGTRVVPIYVGAPEAALIGYAIQSLKTPRPMTHDVMVSLATVNGATIDEVEITDLVENTYLAELHLTVDGRREIVSIRPSDGIAVALRAQVPLGMDATLLERVGTHLEIEDEESEMLEDSAMEEVDETALITELRDFLDSVNPEDFKQ